VTDEIAKHIVDAYKTSPMLTGLLLLNIGIFIGMGWYVVKVQQASGAFVREMQTHILELAKECGNNGP
jgi:hypothetical protein